MPHQPMLLSPRRPPALPSHIDLRCEDTRTVPWPDDIDLVIADPPWRYERRVGASAATDWYDSMATVDIAEHLHRMPGRRLVLWITWPLLGMWMEVTRNEFSWGLPTTGGAWVKSRPEDTGHYGQGYHWAGCSEAVLVYLRCGSATDRSQPLRNAWIEPPSKHSRKPVAWQAQMVRRWCPPGGLVADPWAGLGSVAEAVARAGEGRRYLGAELDPERHTIAHTLVVQGIARMDAR